MSSSSDYSDEYSEDEPVTENNVYTIICNSFAGILEENPLIDDGALSNRIESRTSALLYLSILLMDYDGIVDRHWFNLMHDELSNGITEIAEFIDETDESYTKLQRNMIEPLSREYLSVFDGDFQQYLNDARMNILERFNEYISRGDWIKLNSPDSAERPLPFVDKLRITL